jgi:hypothetical protein
MLRKLKINTAFFVCAAFLFRLLFINASAFASIGSPQNPEVLKHYFSDLKKREALNSLTSDSKAFEMQDVYEEETENEDDFSFVKIPSFFNVFFSFLIKVNDVLQSGISFDHSQYPLFPKKYLTLSTLRI